MTDHDASDCLDPACDPCLTDQRQESVIRLERALLDLETSPEGRAGEWVDCQVTVDALDVRNLLDLLRG
ncbi:hypothetical protein [Nocardioides sp.]|uniref:hypothetical protein n=1 Tax=Nocardioides sp. TaxID=35761 RepID=UPI002B8F333D|nr:hypothetical protein [Nocardioides sp.]HSX68460.1 hypothetical protein [Nocardioides sp.]